MQHPRVVWMKALAFAFCVAASAAEIRAEINLEVVHYTDQDGQRRTIDVGRKCADLWAAPDGSALAFVAIDRVTRRPKFPPIIPEAGPVIDASSIYIARRADHFTPTWVPLKPLALDGTEWAVFRRPSVSPDGSTIFFEIPDSVVIATIMSVSMNSGALQKIGVATDYCVIWSGRYSGQLILERRNSEDPQQGTLYHAT